MGTKISEFACRRLAKYLRLARVFHSLMRKRVCLVSFEFPGAYESIGSNIFVEVDLPCDLRGPDLLRLVVFNSLDKILIIDLFNSNYSPVSALYVHHILLVLNRQAKVGFVELNLDRPHP